MYNMGDTAQIKPMRFRNRGCVVSSMNSGGISRTPSSNLTSKMEALLLLATFNLMPASCRLVADGITCQVVIQFPFLSNFLILESKIVNFLNRARLCLLFSCFFFWREPAQVLLLVHVRLLFLRKCYRRNETRV